MNNSPVFTIITICLNSENTIKKTIESVLNQTYTNFEYIIIDGFSKDKTFEIIKSYQELFCQKGIDYKWISEKDSGIYDAMNKGIKLSRGTIIGILNSDDWYESTSLQQIVNTGDYDLIYGRLKIYDNNKLLYIEKANKKLKLLKKGMILNHPTVFVKKKVYNEIGLFSTEFIIASDWDFIIRVWKNNYTMKGIDEVLANFSIGGASHRFSYKSVKEKHNIRLKNGLVNFIDLYYYFDLLKLILIPKNLVLKISLTINKLSNSLSGF